MTPTEVSPSAVLHEGVWATTQPQQGPPSIETCLHHLSLLPAVSSRYYPHSVTFPSWEVRVYRGFGARVGRAIRSPRGLVSPKPPGFGKIPAGAATASRKAVMSRNNKLVLTQRKYKAQQATRNPREKS